MVQKSVECLSTLPDTDVLQLVRRTWKANWDMRCEFTVFEIFNFTKLLFNIIFTVKMSYR